MNSLRERLIFLSGFFVRPATVRSVSQSTRHMTDRILYHAGAMNGGVVVEWGAGLGVLTRRLLQVIPPDGYLLSFENHPQYARELKRKLSGPQLEVVAEDASKTPEYLRKRGLPKASHIISTIPIRGEDAGQMLDAAAAALEPGGRYVQIGLWCSRELKNSSFQYHGRELVWWNVPPEVIHVMECRNGSANTGG